jgi:hypothetical protein
MPTRNPLSKLLPSMSTAKPWSKTDLTEKRRQREEKKQKEKEAKEKLEAEAMVEEAPPPPDRYCTTCGCLLPLPVPWCLNPYCRAYNP